VVIIERPVTIAAAGAHSTGKSTFLARLAHALRRHDLEVATVADLGEEALRIGLPILHSHTYASTLWIMTRGISQEIATWAHIDVLLIDRPVPDALGY
jgi:signal recognition particle GTPase